MDILSADSVTSLVTSKSTVSVGQPESMAVSAQSAQPGDVGLNGNS